MSDKEIDLVYNLAKDVKKMKKLLQEEENFGDITEDNVLPILGSVEEILRTLLIRASKEKKIK